MEALREVNPPAVIINFVEKTIGDTSRFNHGGHLYFRLLPTFYSNARHISNIAFAEESMLLYLYPHIPNC